MVRESVLKLASLVKARSSPSKEAQGLWVLVFFWLHWLRIVFFVPRSLKALTFFRAAGCALLAV